MFKVPLQFTERFHVYPFTIGMFSFFLSGESSAAHRHEPAQCSDHRQGPIIRYCSIISF